VEYLSSCYPSLNGVYYVSIVHSHKHDHNRPSIYHLGSQLCKQMAIKLHTVGTSERNLKHYVCVSGQNHFATSHYGNVNVEFPTLRVPSDICSDDYGHVYVSGQCILLLLVYVSLLLLFLCGENLCRLVPLVFDSIVKEYMFR
jgi:hypothetical protein